MAEPHIVPSEIIPVVSELIGSILPASLVLPILSALTLPISLPTGAVDSIIPEILSIQPSILEPDASLTEPAVSLVETVQIIAPSGTNAGQIIITSVPVATAASFESILPSSFVQSAFTPQTLSEAIESVTYQPSTFATIISSQQLSSAPSSASAQSLDSSLLSSVSQISSVALSSTHVSSIRPSSSQVSSQISSLSSLSSISSFISSSSASISSQSTITTSTSSSTSSTLNPAIPIGTPVPNRQVGSGTIAAVSISAVGSAVLFAIFALFALRWLAARKSKANAEGQVFPQEAYLYDPPISRAGQPPLNVTEYRQHQGSVYGVDGKSAVAIMGATSKGRNEGSRQGRGVPGDDDDEIREIVDSDIVPDQHEQAGLLAGVGAAAAPGLPRPSTSASSSGPAVSSLSRGHTARSDESAAVSSLSGESHLAQPQLMQARELRLNNLTPMSNFRTNLLGALAGAGAGAATSASAQSAASYSAAPRSEEELEAEETLHDPEESTEGEYYDAQDHEVSDVEDYHYVPSEELYRDEEQSHEPGELVRRLTGRR